MPLLLVEEEKDLVDDVVLSRLAPEGENVVVTLLYEQGVDFVIILGCADVRRLLIALRRSGAPLHLLARLRLDESILATPRVCCEVL